MPSFTSKYTPVQDPPFPIEVPKECYARAVSVLHRETQKYQNSLQKLQ